MSIYARYAAATDGPAFDPIEIEIYEPDPERKGYLKHVRNKTQGEVFNELNNRLKNDECYPDEYFHSSEHSDDPFPPTGWIACYLVTGGSEGHYIHVDVVTGNTRKSIYLGKTFLGFDFAAKVANACAKHLGA